MLELFQIILIVVAAIGMIRSIVLFKRRRFTWGWLIFWLIIWGGLALVSFLPNVSYIVSEPLGIERGSDLIIYLAIILLFYLVFKLLMKVEKVEENVTKLVREIALKKK